MSEDSVSAMGITPFVAVTLGISRIGLRAFKRSIKTAKTEEDFQASVGVPTRARVSLQRKLNFIN